MDIHQLTTFLTLSRLKNFTRSAEELGYAQSSVTAQIQQLEKELGVNLFERIGKKVSLTSEGNALIPFAASIVALSNNIKEAISSPDSRSGSITIGASESLCIYQLPNIIRAYKDKHPNIDIYLKLLKCGEFIPSLSDNSVDLAFSIGDRIDHDSMTILRERSEQILLLAPPTSPLSSRQLITRKEFEQQAFILTGKGCCYRGAFERDLAQENIKIKVVLETDSIQVIKQTAMSGLGLCVLPAISVIEEIRNKSLISLPYANHYPIVSQILHHKNKWISPLLADFIEEASQGWKE